MVHFGHRIRDSRNSEWETHYIDYKFLKKRINESAACASNHPEDERKQAMRSFSKLLDIQVEKVVLFLIQKQGLLAQNLQHLTERHEEALLKPCNDGGKTRIDPDIFEEYRQTGRELLMLIHYLELNTTGIRKILKKFDKRVGFRLGERYLASRINHPYSQLQHVYQQLALGTLMATIAQRLSQLYLPSTESYLSLFEQPAIPSTIMEQEPVIQEIEDVLQRLVKEASLTAFIANNLLLPLSEHGLQNRVDGTTYHFMSIQLNLSNIFLFMLNYYIIVPTAGDYAEKLQVSPIMSGIIIGCMPLTAFLSSFLFSWWSNCSYSGPIILSTFMLIAGNLIYAMALYFNSFWLLLIGRTLNGMGGARAINRRYLMDHVPSKYLINASAAFVVAGSLGMVIGPSLAGLFDKMNFEIFGVAVNSVTAPGWCMTLLWVAYLICFLFYFEEPERKLSILIGIKLPIEGVTSGVVILTLDLNTGRGSTDQNNRKLNSPLLNYDGLASSSRDLGQEDIKDSRPVQNITELWHELTLPVLILLSVYFMLKFAMEMLISESSLITRFYFDWGSGEVGYFLGALGLAVLPICFVVANYVRNIFSERVVIIWSEVLMALGILGSISYYPLLDYTSIQYVLSSIILFASANILEGLTLSLLSSIMPERLCRGTFNCSLLSTEAGMLACAIADGSITLAGKGGLEYLPFLTTLPTLLLCAFTIIYTWMGYYSLF